MANDVLFLGWNRPVPGREHEASELFMQSMHYYESQKKAGNLTSFDVVVLDPHGGELNGFILLRSPRAKLDAIRASAEFDAIMIKASVYLQDVGTVSGVTGDAVAGRIGAYMGALPKR